MKRRELTKELRELGFWTHGGTKHEKWTNGEFATMIPWSNEINECTAKAILKDCRQAKAAKEKREKNHA